MTGAAMLVFICLSLTFFLASAQKPYRYDIKLDVSNLKTSNTFSGSALVYFTIPKETNNIFLDAENLTINSISVQSRQTEATEWKVEEVYYDPNKQVDNKVRLIFSPPLVFDKIVYRTNFTFVGNYQTNEDGFAKIPYIYNETQRYLAVASFKPAHASKVFPCFDDPAHRTNFSLEITVDQAYTVVSNVQHDNISYSPFNKTKTLNFSYQKMPIHRLGWVVLDEESYHSSAANTFSGISVQTWALSGNTGWSTEQTALLNSTMEKYTELNYPYRVHQVVVPKSSIGRSVDGWGFLTYPEDSILISKTKSSAEDYQRVVLALARGVVSQWFGGTVSMDSWKDTSIMEALVEYLKYYIPSTMSKFSDWELTDHVVVEVVQRALAMDIEDHSLGGELEGSAIEGLTSVKGVATFRWLHSILGDAVFKKSISKFLSDETDKPKSLSQLWDKIYSKARIANVNLNKKSVEEIMGSKGWTGYNGHANLIVTWTGSSYKISKQNFNDIPIHVTYLLQHSKEVQGAWMNNESFCLVNASQDQWILVNVNQTGYYRVYYDTPVRNLLFEQLTKDPSQIPRTSRSQLLDDLYYFVQSGRVTAADYLKFTKYLSNEVDYFPWTTALRNFQDMLDGVYNRSSYGYLQRYQLHLMQKVVSSVGLNVTQGDSHTDKLRRAMVLKAACALGHSSCEKEAIIMLKRYVDQDHYEPDLTGALMCTGVAKDPEFDWGRLWAKYHPQSLLRQTILKALTCARHVSLNEFLANITSNHSTTPALDEKDKIYFLKTLASTTQGAEKLLDWLLQILCSADKGLRANSGSNSVSLRRKRRDAANMSSASIDYIKFIITLISPKLSTKEHVLKLDLILNQTDSKTMTDLIRSVREKVSARDMAADSKNSKLDTIEWLKTYSSVTNTPSITSSSPNTSPSSFMAHLSLVVCSVAVVTVSSNVR